MARPLRINLPGGFYHVFSRGNNRADIFYHSSDYKTYLKMLFGCKKKFDLKIHSFILMPNHFHILLENTGGKLPQFMHRLQSNYADYLNSKHDRVGHVFQGRYKSLLVQKDAYLLELSRYIHMNPVKASLATRPELYPWSSVHAYLGKRDNLTTTSAIYSYFPTQQRRKLFYEFTVERSSCTNGEEPWPVQNQSFLGTPEFADEMKRNLADKGSWTEGKASPTDSIIDSVSHEFDLSRNELLGARRNRHVANPRAVLMMLLRKKTDLSLSDVASILGMSRPNSVIVAIGRLSSRLRHTPDLLGHVQNLDAF